ncbi:hypothetical protein FHS96_002594 [Sphingomonas zeicaulis]|uniref:RecB family exonuclease n=1 Tax=Sphingomonas zeicaulis TaxID=1632740 RepID=UPI003D26178F
MNLVFGMACDGPTWPDFPGDADGVFGSDVVGPNGLVGAIETVLGLTAPRRSQAARVARYVAKMRPAIEAAPDLFFASSARLDLWATASTLLRWRDELVGAGWNEQPVGSARIDALASLVADGDPVPAGIDDRVAALRRALTARPKLPIASIELIEPRDLLPPGWRNLINALEACSVAVVDRPDPSPDADGDLGRVQRFLVDGKVEGLAGDGSLAFVEADTALTGAEALAEWLVHGSEEELHGTVVVSTGGDTALLDLALQARGLPALGQSAASPWRGALQVLPLAIAVAWAPFDARALLDLLLLPRPPVPRRIARRLANALGREPGIGGSEWKAAWETIEDGLAAEVASGEIDREKADRRLAGWREWTTGGLYRRDAGIPAEAVRGIAGRVQAWALELDAGSGDPLLLAAAGAASALIEAVDLVELEMVPALLLERMLDQVTAEGAQNPDHVATAGGLRCVRHPSAIWSKAPRLLWWDFKGPGERVSSSPWSIVEIAALNSAGCVLETTADAARRVARSYANAVLMAGERVMLVTPAFTGTAQATSHPLEHQLQPVVAKARPLVTWDAERLLQEADHLLLGRDLRRERIEVGQPPTQRATWTIPEGVKSRLAARTESATSFERLVECQMRWLMIDVMKLSRGRAAEIPDANQLLGNLAHELANTVMRPGEAPDPEQVLAEVAERFDATVDAIASPLRRPEHASELAAAKVRVPQALAKLAGMLRDRNAEVVGTELERDRTFADGLSVAGRLDLLVRHPGQGLGVVDLKWSRSATRRRTELAEGRALQLATYGELADPAASVSAEGAYYLLAQRRMIGLAGSFLADEEIASDHTLAETWDALAGTWRIWRDLTLTGTLVASGTDNAADHLPADLPIAPGTEPCRYCELTGLCRVVEEDI